MLFNSLDFAVFLPVVCVLYWLVSNNIRLQNALIVVASYFFYGWWDCRFSYICTVFSLSLFERPAAMPYATLLFILFLVAIEWMGRKDQYAITFIGSNWKRGVRRPFYYALILVIFTGTSQEFIYF